MLIFDVMHVSSVDNEEKALPTNIAGQHETATTRALAELRKTWKSLLLDFFHNIRMSSINLSRHMSFWVNVHEMKTETIGDLLRSCFSSLLHSVDIESISGKQWDNEKRGDWFKLTRFFVALFSRLGELWRWKTAIEWNLKLSLSRIKLSLTSPDRIAVFVKRDN